MPQIDGMLRLYGRLSHSVWPIAMVIAAGCSPAPPNVVSVSGRVTLAGEPPASSLPAYSRVALDVLDGVSALSVRGDEAEEAWRVVTPVLSAWAEGSPPLVDYPAGSTGPPPLEGVDPESS